MVGRAVIPRSRKPSEPPGCVGAIPAPSASLLPRCRSGRRVPRRSAEREGGHNPSRAGGLRLAEPSSCSSKAEHPADKGKTAERCRAGRPFRRVASNRASFVNSFCGRAQALGASPTRGSSLRPRRSGGRRLPAIARRAKAGYLALECAGFGWQAISWWSCR